MMSRLRSPYSWIPIGAALTWLPMIVAQEIGWVFSLAGLCLFSVVSPLTCALGSHWWRDTLISIAAWIGIFMVLGMLPAITILREGATVFLLPMMVYPVAVLISGLVRLARWRMRPVGAA
jgi:hypothetical protein